MSLLEAVDPVGAAQQQVLGYGVVGVAALALGWFAWGTIKRERARSDALEARLNSLNDSIRTDFVPVMTRATDALARLADHLDELSSSSPRRRS
jgi:hypothetical protein